MALMSTTTCFLPLLPLLLATLLLHGQIVLGAVPYNLAGILPVLYESPRLYTSRVPLCPKLVSDNLSGRAYGWRP